MEQNKEPLAKSFPTASQSESGSSCGEDPIHIGRFRVIRLLGEGGYGSVYLARDERLARDVAVKVPNSLRTLSAESLDEYLREAKIVASLEHPNIVPVYDAGRTEAGLCYIVSKFVKGSDLKATFLNRRPTFLESAELVATVSEALHYAHTKGLVHRDVKPANILIDECGRPYVADFGLALRDEDFGREAVLTGTPVYMSPEQARGEGHWVDGRSDIFSLGVVFYELLTGRRPFQSNVRGDVLDQIKHVEARPPRQIDDGIPRELERICLKALAKKATDRYTTARDMAEDLSAFVRIASPTARPSSVAPSPGLPQASTPEAAPAPPASGRSDSSRPPVKIVPKGLRSFDEHDAEFFLELLPGPRDRHGLPESIRFWKNRIESTDPDRTFRVGLVYGPSGCGKSSLVKAGLLPRLDNRVITIHVEATADDTESRLLRELRKAFPELPAGLGLAESLAAARKGRILHSGQKLLLVLDQFEQWLHARRGEAHGELVDALRQCDGTRSQAIVMVRDDFWMAATRFMRNLEIRLVEGENSAAIDLFDLQHAQRVLVAFGRAFGRLPENPGDTLNDQKDFVKESVYGLAEEGRVFSVRLALFAEMMKGRPWSHASLRAVGGIKGVGVTFLSETFSAGTAPPEHRLHQKAAQSVLKALLPDAGTDIKGQMRSRKELLERSGYANRPTDFDHLIHILDSELRLITPTDPEGSERLKAEGGRMNDGQESGSALDSSFILPPSSFRYYQLAHDYLVPSLRDWLTREQRETRRGRAELCLAERSSLWNAKTENRHLPSIGEWADIRLLTREHDWSDAQKRMMKRAGRIHGLRALGLTAVAAILLAAGVAVRDRVVNANRETVAHGLVHQLLKADTAQVPENIGALASYRQWADADLKKAAQQEPADSRARLHASLALLPGDATQAEYLRSRLLAASPIDLPVIWGILREHDREAEPRLWKLLDDAAADPEKRFRAACALASADSGRNDEKWRTVAPFVADHLLATVIRNPADYAVLIETLRPLRRGLVSALSLTFQDPSKSDSERSLATSILADYAANDAERLADVLMSADAKPFATLFPVAQRMAGEVLPLLQAEIEKSATSVTTTLPNGQSATPSVSRRPVVSEEAKDRLAARQARAAVALVRLGKPESVWSLLRHSADPRLRSFIVNWLSPFGADQKPIASELARIDAQSTRRGSPAAAEATTAALDVGRGSPDPAPPGVGVGRGSPDPARARTPGRPTSPIDTPGAGVGRGSPDPAPPGAGVGRGSPDPARARTAGLPPSPMDSPDAGVGRGSPDPARARTAGLPSSPMDAILFHPETSTRRALILALGTYGTDDFSPGERQPLIEKLLKQYENDPDSGIHGAAEWTLRKWGQLAKIADVNARLLKQKYRSGRRWFVNTQGQTFVKVEGPTKFQMGSPASEPDRVAGNETRHRRVIPRRFAIAAKEVTVEDYQKFVLESPDHHRSISRYNPDRTGPMNGTSWFDAAAYCNWLSRKEGLEECYEPNSQKKYAQGMTIRADALGRSGYRLPTESEWEYSCRAGAGTSRYYGASVELLSAYAWYQKSSADRVWPGGGLLPNDLGLFDMLGNVHEWCQDAPLAFRPDHHGSQVDNMNSAEAVTDLRELRGGAFTYQPSHLRSAIRDGYGPANRNKDNGFRLARTY